LADKYTLVDVSLGTRCAWSTSPQLPCQQELRPKANEGLLMNLIKNTASVFTLLLFCFPLPSVADNDTNSSSKPQFKLGLSQGIKHEDFYWSISGGPSPNILSELQWNNMDLQYTQLKLDAKQQRFLARIEFDYGQVTSGWNQDSDYYQDNRTEEYSRSYSDVNGETLGFNLALGYEIQPSKSRIRSLTPMIGFSKYEQKLGMRAGEQVIRDVGTINNPNIILLDPPIPITGLDSSYDTDWNTLWAGGEINFLVEPKFEITFGYQYHFNIDYSATANWNLQPAFQHPVSFTHEAGEGHGHRFNFSAHYQFRPALQFNFYYTYFKLKATDGLDVTYYPDNTTATTGLNIAETESHSVTLGLTWTP
jgi:hypothetical protein